jgi:hypothetical protein
MSDNAQIMSEKTQKNICRFTRIGLSYEVVETQKH